MKAAITKELWNTAHERVRRPFKYGSVRAVTICCNCPVALALRRAGVKGPSVVGSMPYRVKSRSMLHETARPLPREVALVAEAFDLGAPWHDDFAVEFDVPEALLCA